ncbi:MAG: metallophosphatase family protein [Bacteroidales bacterium]|jgi:putative phosphoesterase|nr:metallophosphatase family protein [Bacteroidales bacterium]
MTRLGIMSDSHGRVPPQVYTFFQNVDIILHCGDIGSADVLAELQHFKKTIAVCGNIDSKIDFPSLKDLLTFNIEGVKVLMTHIGGYPSHYPAAIKKILQNEKPHLFLCGHSHICKVMFDNDMNLLHINPGACGKYGIHLKCTLVRLEIDREKMQNLDVMEYDR